VSNASAVRLPGTPPSEADLQAIADRIRSEIAELVPGFRSRERETERIGHLTDETIAELDKAGVFKISMPSEYGGYELTCRQQNDIIGEAARGSGATAFVMSIIQAGTWWCSLYDPKAGDEAFADKSGPRANGVFTPRGTLTRQGDGYVLNGVYPFVSGGAHVEWCNVGAMTDAADGPQELVLCMFPMASVERLDDWDVGGYKGTGSNTIRIENVEIPPHRIMPLGPAFNGEYVSDRPGALYRSTLVPWTLAMTSGPAIGLAKGALEVFLERIQGRPITYTHYEHQEEAPLTHLQVAEASMLIDEAQFHGDRAADDVDLHARDSLPWTTRERARVRADVARAAQLSYKAIDILFLASGGSVVRNSEFLQHAKRDISAINVHGLFSPENTLELFGRVTCGQEPKTILL
jgi:alkylation response protein AidB-like acyl-CoA dehydrogenase